MISVLGSNESKTMPFFNMAKVLNRIAKDRDVLILFNYMPYQKKDALEIFSFCEEETQKKIAIDFYEEDLRKFIAITSQCHALIGNEGGATNMAKAIAIPTFTIFSPIVPKQDWNLFENEKTNISVHISDYTLILDTDKTNASIKEKKYEMLYQLFEPKLFEDKLVHFLDNNAIK